MNEDTPNTSKLVLFFIIVTIVCIGAWTVIPNTVNTANTPSITLTSTSPTPQEGMTILLFTDNQQIDCIVSADGTGEILFFPGELLITITECETLLHEDGFE